MLKVLGFSKPSDETIENDEYIPISIKWGIASTGAVLYWRTGDNEHSLLEIGIDAHTQVICSLTLVLTPTIFENLNAGRYENPRQAFGSPICDLSKWGNSTYLDDLYPFEVVSNKDRLLIDLQSHTFVESFLVAGRTRFGMNKTGELCLVEITAIPDQIMSTLREYHIFRR